MAKIPIFQGALELMLFHYKWADIRINHVDKLADDIIQYYKENIAFIRQLSVSFGFSPHFIYQPIGLLHDNQPFLTAKFLESNDLSIYKAVDSRVRNEIMAGHLAMEDCSRSIADAGIENAYVDPAHYSPHGSSIVAVCILERV